MQDPRNLPGIDIEMAGAMLKSRERQPEGAPDVTVTPIADVRAQYLAERAYWNEDGPALPRITDQSVKGPHGPIPIRLYYPRGNPNLPLLIYLHGGGFIKGSIESHDKICRWIASRSGAAVASVDYRLAPEHKFPTPLEEAVATIIPYRNSPALVAYYLGLFSLVACIPFVGIVGIGMAVTALVCGVKGLRRASEDPAARGRVHAWIGIICGAVCGFLGVVFHILLIVALLASAAGA